MPTSHLLAAGRTPFHPSRLSDLMSILSVILDPLVRILKDGGSGTRNQDAVGARKDRTELPFELDVQSGLLLGGMLH